MPDFHEKYILNDFEMKILKIAREKAKEKIKELQNEDS
jgi:hypothetical protein